jgi:hypothetical protein
MEGHAGGNSAGWQWIPRGGVRPANEALPLRVGAAGAYFLAARKIAAF